MENIKRLQKHARDVEDYFLEGIANGNILDYSMEINHDDLAIDVYYRPNWPIKKITTTVVVKKPL